MTNNLIPNEIKKIIKEIYLYAHYYANSFCICMKSEYLDELLPIFERIFEENKLDTEVFTKDINTGRYNNYIEVLFELFINNPEIEVEDFSRTKYGWYDKENFEFNIDIYNCEIEDEINDIKDEHQDLIKWCVFYICESFGYHGTYELTFVRNNEENVKLLEKTKNN